MTAYLKTSNAITIGFLVAMLWHFGTVVGLFGMAPVGQGDMFIRLAMIIGLTVGVAIFVAMAINKRQGSPMLPDEREEKIERISEAFGVITIYIGLLVLAWCAFAPLSPMQIVNGILIVVSFTEFVKLLIVLFLHNREVI